MPVTVERAYERTIRIDAPIDSVYEEMDTVSLLARFIPQVNASTVGSENEHGAYVGNFSFGPLSYQVEGEMAIERSEPMHSLDVVLRAPSLRLELDGTFDLTECALNETSLRYAATIRSTHPLLRRMPSALIGALEEHVDTTTELIAVRTYQYTQARRLLAEPE